MSDESRNTALVQLAKSQALANSDVPEFLRLATETAARVLGVARVSIWLFDDSRKILRCTELYEKDENRHGAGAEIESESCPRYFAALERGRSVVANDARTDPATSEFKDSYLVPLGITSMLDAPLRSAGELIGVVCHEHVGSPRVWDGPERDFSASVADFVSLVLETRERRRAQRAFRSAQTELLRQQWQAREQVEALLEVAARTAHDLCNPLGKIVDTAEELKRQIPDDHPEWGERLGIIGREVRDAVTKLDLLLGMSRQTPPDDPAPDRTEPS